MIHIEKYIPQLIPLYCEPQRTYHSLQHIHGIIRLIKTNKYLSFIDSNKINEGLAGSFRTKNILETIAWFHDCYYDPYLGSPMNEEISAKIFGAMVPISQSSYRDDHNENEYNTVYNGILATAKHIEDISGDYMYEPEVLLFMDLDMHNFCDEAEFLKNGDLIRKEYPATNDIQFFKGRKWFFETILNKSKFYYTYKQEFEDAARRNIENSLKDIDAFLSANV